MINDFVKLPVVLARKQAIINIKNNDNRSFAYAIAASLHPVARGGNKNRPLQYERFFEPDGLNALNFPVAPCNIPAIEQQLSVAINVFSFFDEGKGLYPIYISALEGDSAARGSVDLLYWEEHWALISKFSRFIATINRHQHKIFLCRGCFKRFNSDRTLGNHQPYCSRAVFNSNHRASTTARVAGEGVITTGTGRLDDKRDEQTTVNSSKPQVIVTVRSYGARGEANIDVERTASLAAALASLAAARAAASTLTTMRSPTAELGAPTAETAAAAPGTSTNSALVQDAIMPGAF